MDNDKPDAKQMPIGLLMSLAQHDKAMKNFSRLDDSQREKLVNYTTSAVTGEEAKNKIDTAIQKLEKNDTGFLS